MADEKCKHCAAPKDHAVHFIEVGHKFEPVVAASGQQSQSSANYVTMTDASLDGNPSCHVCGAIFTPAGILIGRIFKRTHWICMSCGTTTQPEPSAPKVEPFGDPWGGPNSKGNEPTVTSTEPLSLAMPEPVAGTQVEPPIGTGTYRSTDIDPRVTIDYVSAKSAPLVGHQVAGQASSDDLREALSVHFLGGTTAEETKAAGTNLSTSLDYSPVSIVAETVSAPQCRICKEVKSHGNHRFFARGTHEFEPISLSAPSVAGTPAVARCPKCEGTKFGWIKVYCRDCNKVHELRGRQMEQFFPAQPLRTPPAPEQDEYEYPPQIQKIHDRCEVNVVSFSNDDVSELLCEIKRLSRLVGQ